MSRKTVEISEEVLKSLIEERKVVFQNAPI